MLWLERTPLWIIGLAVLVGFTLAQQLGYAARRVTLRSGRAQPDSSSFGYLISAALALLGLLIAFTFGAASQRFDTRRILVVQEANAVGTTYLRFQALDDAPRAALSQLMVEYVKARDAYFRAGEDSTSVRLAVASGEELKSRIWTELVAVVRTHPEATINPSLLETTNQMFDLAASRQAANDGRLPITILRSVLIYGVIAAAIIGYGMASGPRQIVVSTLLFMALALAICLILDLDRPSSGTIRISEVPMNRTIASIQAMEAAKQAAPPRSAP